MRFAHSVFLDDFLATRTGEQPPQLEFEQLPFSHPLFIMFSSGTTGAPKCMVHSAGVGLSVRPSFSSPGGSPLPAGVRVTLHPSPGPSTRPALQLGSHVDIWARARAVGHCCSRCCCVPVPTVVGGEAAQCHPGKACGGSASDFHIAGRDPLGSCELNGWALPTF